MLDCCFCWCFAAELVVGLGLLVGEGPGFNLFFSGLCFSSLGFTGGSHLLLAAVGLDDDVGEDIRKASCDGEA